MIALISAALAAFVTVLFALFRAMRIAACSLEAYSFKMSSEEARKVDRYYDELTQGKNPEHPLW